MPDLKAYQKHVDRFGHEDVMVVAAADSDMSDKDVKKLGLYIAQTAKRVIKPGKERRS